MPSIIRGLGCSGAVHTISYRIFLNHPVDQIVSWIAEWSRNGGISMPRRATPGAKPVDSTKLRVYIKNIRKIALPFYNFTLYENLRRSKGCWSVKRPAPSGAIPLFERIDMSTGLPAPDSAFRSPGRALFPGRSPVGMGFIVAFSLPYAKAPVDRREARRWLRLARRPALSAFPAPCNIRSNRGD